jgi:hypothetical protein
MPKANPGRWVPMRWPCGPLAIEQGQTRAGFTAREKDVLSAWTKPESLAILAGTPIDCLVVPWADGGAGDAAQQAALAPLLAAARERGLAVVGWVAGPDLRPAALAAHAAGLAALATESEAAVDGIDVLRFRKRSLAPLADGFLGDAEAAWAGMRPLQRTKDVDAMSGATSRPWIDSNAWYVRLARAALAPNAIWLPFEPPAGRPLDAAAYVQAIADGEMAGARWIVALDAALRAGLAEGRERYRETWRRIARGLAFFEQHAAWRGFSPLEQIGVLADYSGENEFMATEALNLLARRSAFCRVLPSGREAAFSLEGLDSVLCLDAKPASAALATKLHAFAEAGGTLVTAPGWEARGTLDEAARFPRFRVYRCGKGRLAIARDDFSDPELLAEDTQLLTSHRNDRVRVFNLGVGLFQHATSADGQSGVLHTVAFPLAYQRGPLAVWFLKPWARGRVLTPEAETDAKRVPVDGGVEFHLPPVPAYAALEVTA